MMPRCESCRWFDAAVSSDRRGACHRRAPVAVPAKDYDHSRVQWPRVQPSDYCGEWQPKDGGA